MRKSFIIIVLMYGVIFGTLFFWQVCGDLHNHPANPRYYAMFKTDRGVIFDRSGIPWPHQWRMERSIHAGMQLHPSVTC